MLRLHDRLVAATVLRAIGLVWLVLLGLDLVFALLDELGRVGGADSAAQTALMIVLLTIPRRLYDLFPFASVIGALLGMGSLAASSELTALRSLGLSRARIAGGALATVAALVLLLVINAETLAPSGERASRALATRVASSDLISARWTGVWAREGNVFIHARQGTVRDSGVFVEVELADLHLFEFGPDGRLLSLARAKRARFREGALELYELRQTRLQENRAIAEERAQLRWQSSLDPTALAASVARPRTLPIKQLLASLDYLRRNGLDPRPFEDALWARLFYPIDVLALVLAALPFAFGQLRSGGLGKRVFAGIVFGLLFFVIERFAVNLANVYDMNLALARLAPPSLLLLASWRIARRVD